MSLSQALTAAISGMRANQAGLALVAANVANADTPGYTRKTVNQVANASEGTYIGVSVQSIQRELDTYVQKQLRVENAGASYADTRAQFYQQLQTIYGQPGADDSLESVYNDFTDAVQALTTSPDDTDARNGVINTAQILAGQLNQMSDSIQGLRENAELGIADAVNQANEAMSQIATLNQRIGASAGHDDSETATLEDQRDSYIDQLSQLMDINVVQGSGNQVSIYTNSGVQLVGTQAAQLSFDAQGMMTPASQWSADPSQRTVGTITLTSPNGGSVDLVQAKAFRSGTIAALLQMRDQDLVQAQSQLDALAAGMASALSDTTTAGTAVTSGTQSGFSVDIGGLSAGNTISVGYTDAVTGKSHTITFERVDDPSALPLSDDATAAAGDKVVGIDFSAGMASVIAQINAALAPAGMSASNPSGTTLQVLDSGPGGPVTVNSLSATTTATSLSGGAALPLFTDGTGAYTGAMTGLGSQSVGFAGRIAVNASLIADPSQLVVYQPGTPTGDDTRPTYIYQQLTDASLTYPPGTGIGTATAPFTGSTSTFLRQIVSQQGAAADAADRLKQGQDVVLSSLQQRFSDTSQVNVDQEMANLLTLQNAYAANARVMSAVNDMFNMLMQM